MESQKAKKWLQNNFKFFWYFSRLFCWSCHVRLCSNAAGFWHFAPRNSEQGQFFSNSLEDIKTAGSPNQRCSLDCMTNHLSRFQYNRASHFASKFSFRNRQATSRRLRQSIIQFLFNMHPHQANFVINIEGNWSIWNHKGLDTPQPW